jgi:protocatechuate 3,4-dioxygenase beta subunit
VDVPDRYYAEDPIGTVELRDPRSCAEVERRLYDNGRLAGRVVDSGGRPVPGLTIELGTTKGTQTRRTITDRDGRYEFGRLPSARFVIGIQTSPHSKNELRASRVFHPGVEKLASATPIAVGPGARVALDDFKVPGHLHYVAVSGVVFDPDGWPAQGARVYLKGVDEGTDYILSEPATADASGRFVIAALAGADYRVFAERSRSVTNTPRMDASDQLRLTVVEGLKPLRLTLRRRY